MVVAKGRDSFCPSVLGVVMPLTRVSGSLHRRDVDPDVPVPVSLGLVPDGHRHLH